MTAERPEDCKEIFAQLSAYLDLELPDDACQRIREHIEGCAPCVEFVNSLRKAIAVCRQYRPEELPAAVSQEARETLMAAYRQALSNGAQQ